MPKRCGPQKWPPAPKWIRRYGLPEEESLDTSSEEPKALSDVFFDDVHGTAKSLESLKQHSDFAKWKQGQNLSADTLAKLEKKLHIYSELRQSDSEGFRRLLDEPLNKVTKMGSWHQYILHYIMNTALTAIVCILNLWSSSMIFRVASFIFVASNIWHWLGGTSLYGRFCSLWLEDTKLSHRANPKAAFLANLLEVLYFISTFGIGAILSLGLCIFSRLHQTLFERMFSLRLVKEHASPFELGQTVFLTKKSDIPVQVECFSEKSSGSKVTSKSSRGRQRKSSIKS